MAPAERMTHDTHIYLRVSVASIARRKYPPGLPMAESKFITAELPFSQGRTIAMYGVDSSMYNNTRTTIYSTHSVYSMDSMYSVYSM